VNLLSVQKSVGEWLRLLHLEQYLDTLVRQGYGDMENITCITWEDLEDIGIQLLGKIQYNFSDQHLIC